MTNTLLPGHFWIEIKSHVCFFTALRALGVLLFCPVFVVFTTASSAENPNLMQNQEQIRTT